MTISTSTQLQVASNERPDAVESASRSAHPTNRSPAESGSTPIEPSIQKLPVPATLEVVEWVLDERLSTSFSVRSDYVEKYWLSLLGPSTTWMVRRFARGLEERPDGFRVDMAEIGIALGLGESLSKNSSTQRSVLRACQFGAAYRVNVNRLAVRTHLPLLNHRQLSRLPERLRGTHDRYIDQPIDEEELRRAVAGASGLAAAGERPSEIELQLQAWGYGPRIASDATRATQGWDI